MKDLVIPDSPAKVLTIFTDKVKVNEILQGIKEKALAHKPDLSTPSGRKEIASIAFKVSRSKVILDTAGKNLVADWKQKAKLVDSSRREMRDFLDDLRDTIRRPLKEWETEEAKRHALIKAEKERQNDWNEALEMHQLFLKKQELVKRENRIRQLEEEAIQRRDAIRRKEEKAEARRLEEKEAMIRQQKQEQARLVQKRQEEERLEAVRQAAQQEILHQVKIQEDQRKKEALQKLQEEQAARKKAERAKIAIEERAKLEAILAKEKADYEKAEAIQEAKEKAQQEQKQAIQETKEKAQHDAQVEQERVIKQVKSQALSAPIINKASIEPISKVDKARRQHVNESVYYSLINNGIPAAIARLVVIRVSRGEIEALTIIY